MQFTPTCSVFRRVRLALLATVIVGSVGVSCSRPPRTGSNKSDYPIPAAIVVDSIVEGMVAGMNLQKPFGLATDVSGRVYVVDAGNQRLIQFSSSMSVIRDAGGYGMGDGSLNQPTFVAVDNELNIVVADEGNRRLCRFDNRLNFVEEIAFFDIHRPNAFGRPSGLAFTTYGEMWVSDRENNSLVILDNQGSYEQTIGDFGYSGGQLRTPEKIVPLRTSKFVVADAGNRRLVIYDHYGGFSYDIPLEEMVYPISVAVDDGDGYWVLDGGGNMVVCLGPDGEVLFSVGPTIPGSESSLKDPSDIIFLRDGRLLISDTGNNRLLVCRIIYLQP